MTEKITRIFICRNGHTYESKEPVTTGWAEAHPSPRSLLVGPRIRQNDFCKICGADIVAEKDFVNGKNIMGAIRI